MKKSYKIFEVTTKDKLVPDGYYNRTISTFKFITPNSQLDWTYNSKEDAETALEKYADQYTTYIIQEIYVRE